MKNNVMFRQGDVLIRSTNITEKGDAIERDNGRVVLAYGEVTGHAHAIAAPNAKLFALAGEMTRYLLQVTKTPVELKHEEHSTIVLPPGNYEVVRQREYTPQGLRNVAD